MYKYMPLRKAFFENGLVRATQRLALNDPFEVLPSNSWLQGACDRALGMKIDRNADVLVRDVTRLNLLGFGVVSLTSRCDNLLMWTHYAKEHQGMVVEIDVENPRIKERFGCDQDKRLTLDVIYRKDRLHIFQDNDKFLPYLYKSIEWAYEEESRIVVTNPQENCDLIMHVFDNEAAAQNAYENGCMAGLTFRKCTLSGRAVQVKPCDIECTQHPKTTKSIDPINFYHECSISPNFLLSNKNLMSMYEIPKESIKSVIFGVNACKKEVEHICDLIESDPNLKHINIRYARLSEGSFGVDILNA